MSPSSDENERRLRAELEVENGLRQYDFGLNVIRDYLTPDRPFALRSSLIRQLQVIAVDGLEPTPGEWRKTPVRISQSRHRPPPSHLVPGLIEEMCDYINDMWHEKPPFHLSAYVMWRHNWIHPFTDGNGRTSRMVSYIVLSVSLGDELPGTPSIPQQIEEDRRSYFEALEAADDAYAQGCLDVTKMENLLKNMLANQLLSVINKAGGS